jgi:(4S)-4-hydroxy-5-phosphonooxypentane-2,3-dione isomerase
MLVIVAEMEVQEGKSSDFFDLISRHAQTSLAQEPGCKRFDICQAEENPSKFLFYEHYVNAAAFDDHAKTDRFAALFAKIGPMLAGPPSIRRFNLTGAQQ